MRNKWIFVILFVSCRSNLNTKMSSAEVSRVKDSLTAMTDRISRDLSERGPVAWLNYFEESPNFYMASDGAIAFKDYQTARTFIRDTLVKTFKQILLHWDHMRIDPLTPDLASIGSDFHEELKDLSGKSAMSDGYFSAIAEKTAGGWQLRNAHLSISKQK